MHIATQFSIFMVNKPGVLARVLNEIAQAKINIVAITMMDSVEHGVMRVVFGAPEKAKTVLANLNLSYNETQVLCINLANKSGELAAVAEKLAKSHMNITYAYCTAGAQGGRTTGILKVADVKRAMKILEKSHGKENNTKSQPLVRRPKSARR